MSFFDKIVGSMRISDDDDDDYIDDEEEFEERPRKGLFSKAESADDDDEDDYEEPRGLFARKSSAPAPVTRKALEVSMVKPVTPDDSREISDLLRSGKAVVINMEGLHTEIAQRIIDFTSGATYSMDGKLQKISNYIFIATPPSVDLSGDFQDVFGAGGLDIPGLNSFKM